MNVIECPAVYPDCMSLDAYRKTTMFIAGGITGCPDWQKEMIARFAPKLIAGKPGPDEYPDLVLFNPRRATFDITNPKESDFQIEWEHQHLLRSNAILFWFPFYTLCPITLYELGVAAASGKKMFVGCHPAYARAFDVKKQLELIRPDVQVRDNFADIVNDVTEWLNAK